MKKGQVVYSLFIVAIVAVVAIVSLFMMADNNYIDDDNDLSYTNANEDLAGQAIKIGSVSKSSQKKINVAKTDSTSTVYNLLKSEFAKQGLSEDEMLKRLARSDILFLDLQRNNPEQDVATFHALVKLNQKKKLESKETTAFKKTIQNSLMKTYQSSSLQDIKDTAYLIAKEDFFKSSTYGFSMNSIAAAKMPFGMNLQKLKLGGDLGKGGSNTGVGDVGEKSIAKKDNANDKCGNFAQCVKGKMNQDTPGGTPNGNAGAGNLGMSGEAGGGNVVTNNGGFFGGNTATGVNAPLGAVDKNNICGDGSTGVYYETSKNPKDHSWSASSGWGDKQWSIKYTPDKVNNDGSISGSMTVKEPDKPPVTTPTTSSSSTQNNQDFKDAKQAVQEAAKDSCDHACTEPSKSSNSPKDKGDPNDGAKTAGSSNYNPDGSNSNCGESVADCFDECSSDGTGACKVTSAQNPVSGGGAVVDGGYTGGGTGGVTVSYHNVYSGNCGCFGKMGAGIPIGANGENGITDTGVGTGNQEGASSGCQGDAGKALELANLGMFFTDPSPMLAMSTAQMTSKTSAAKGTSSTKQQSSQTAGMQKGSSSSSAGGSSSKNMDVCIKPPCN